MSTTVQARPDVRLPGSVDPKGGRSGSGRMDGPDKVMGRALYVDDLREDELGFVPLHGSVVTSTVAKGRIMHIDASDAEAVPGVRLVMTHENAPRLGRVFSGSMSEIGSLRPLQDDRVRYHGQAVAVVVAETPEAVREAASLVRVTYDEERGAFTLDAARDRLKPVLRAGMAPGRIKGGNAKQDYDASPVRLDREYSCAPHHHNPMEIGSAIARWDEDGGVTVHAAVQWHHVDTLAIGQAFGLGWRDGMGGFLARTMGGRSVEGRVRLVNHLAGGAFGRNLNPVQVFLACMAAKLAGAGVKVSLTRAQTFSLLSYRGEVRQRLRLGAERDGRLRTMIVDADVAVGAKGRYVEPVGSWSCQIYAHGSRLLRHRIARLDLNAPGWMRAPGGSSAMFALESAMDELAHETGLDPLDIRILNHADRDPESGKPWTSKNLRECYRRAAAAIGWHERPRGGTMDDAGRLVGYGMATSYEPCFRFPASVKVELRPDGTALVSASVAEMGQGIWAGLRTLGARSLGLPRERVNLRTGTSDLPAGSGSVGSAGLVSTGGSLEEAAAMVRRDLLARAVADPSSPLHGEDADTLSIEDGIVQGRGNLNESVEAIMRRHPGSPIAHGATTGRNFGLSRSKKSAFGAVFARVSLDPVTLAVRVERVVGAFDCGRILEPAIARSQLAGGMVWGIGQAMMEESLPDPRTGRWLNANLAEALIATHADVREVEAILVEPESEDAPLKGLSEIGVLGPAPAIANAIFDATGFRMRALPIRPEHLLKAAEDRVVMSEAAE